MIRAGMQAVGLVLATACTLQVSFSDQGDGPDATAFRQLLPLDCSVLIWGGHVYGFCGTPRTWQAAQDACVAARGRLVRVDDAGENDWLRLTALQELASSIPSLTDRLWLGGTDVDGQGHWRWTDGTQFSLGAKPVGTHYACWETGAPGDATPTDDCLRMLPASGPGWLDVDCDLLGAFVCEDY